MPVCGFVGLALGGQVLVFVSCLGPSGPVGRIATRSCATTQALEFVDVIGTNRQISLAAQQTEANADPFIAQTDDLAIMTSKQTRADADAIPLAKHAHGAATVGSAGLSLILDRPHGMKGGEVIWVQGGRLAAGLVADGIGHKLAAQHAVPDHRAAKAGKDIAGQIAAFDAAGGTAHGDSAGADGVKGIDGMTGQPRLALGLSLRTDQQALPAGRPGKVQGALIGQVIEWQDIADGKSGGQGRLVHHAG